MQKKALAGLTVLLGFLILVPLFIKLPFPLHIFIMIFIFTVTGTSWNILSGLAGQISLGHSVFFGSGAYTSTILLVKFGVNPWIGIIAGILVTMVLGWLIGKPCFRLEGRYFSIATMAIVQIVYMVFLRWDWAGGARGLYFPLKDWGIAAFAFRDKAPYYYIALIMMLISLAIFYLIEKSRVGYYLKTIREDPDAARALGIDVPKYKMIAMMFSALLASMAGTLFGQYMLFIDPDSVFMLSVPIMLTTVMGGTGSMWGPLVGATVLIPIQEVARVYFSGSGRAVDQLLYGIIIVSMVVAQPEGIMGWVKTIIESRKSSQSKQPVVLR